MLTLTLSYILITLWCSRYRDARPVFGISTALFIGCIGTTNDIPAQTAFPSLPLLPIVVWAVSFLLLFLILRRFSGAYREMLLRLDRGWVALDFIPIAAFLTELFLPNVLIPLDPLCGLVALYGLLDVCGCAYFLMYLFFVRVKRDNDAQHSQHLLEVQLSAPQSRMEAVQTSEEAIRIERHDLRHRFRTIAELVTQGKIRCRVIDHPKLMFKLSTPYTGSVKL